MNTTDRKSEGLQKPDPRVFFAAERTLLAWVRTAIAVIGLGFLVAKFGFFLRLVSGNSNRGASQFSTFIGVGLVVLGTLLISVIGWQHARFLKQLGPHDLPKGYIATLSVWLSGLLVVAGIILAVYLMISADSSGTFRATTSGMGGASTQFKQWGLLVSGAVSPCQAV